jgi:hypothetical protein
MKNKKEQKPLSQGSTLLLFLLAVFLFCACAMASTLAFVSSFRNERTTGREETKSFYQFLKLIFGFWFYF